MANLIPPILVPDVGTVIVAAVTGTIAAFNLTLWSLRKLGLRAFSPPVPEVANDTVTREEQPQLATSGAPRCSHT